MTTCTPTAAGRQAQRFLHNYETHGKHSVVFRCVLNFFSGKLSSTCQMVHRGSGCRAGAQGGQGVWLDSHLIAENVTCPARASYA